jgi:tetratricopeptide (TPR) repeat protein
MRTAVGLYRQAGRTGEVDPLDEAIALVRGVASELAQVKTPDAEVAAEFGRFLSLRFRLRTDTAALDQAIEVFRAGIAEADPDDPGVPACLNNLGNALADQYEATGQVGVLDEIESVFRTAIQSVPPDDWRLPTFFTGLSDALLNRYRSRGDGRDLDEALRAARLASESYFPGDPVIPVLLNGLANVLLERYERFRDTEALREAEHVLNEGIEETDPGTLDRALVLDTLAALLSIRYEAGGDVTDLDQAERLLTECLDITPGGHPLRAGRLNNLGSTHYSRYLATGDPGAQAAAIEVFRTAVASLPDGHTYLAPCYANLSNVLMDRYTLVGDPEALDEAVAVMRSAVGLSPSGPGSAMYLSGLSSVLLRRYERLENQTDLVAAESAGRQALAVSPLGDDRRPIFLNGLASVLRRRYALDEDPATLAAAEQMFRQALSGSPDGDRRRLACLANLGNVLHDQFRLTRRPAVLADAIDMLRQAERLAPRGHGSRPSVLEDLGRTLAESYALDNNPGLLAEASSALTEVIDTTMAPAHLRVRAARHKGDITAAAGQWAAAADAYGRAIGLLPEVAPHDLNRRHREHGLGAFTGLASDAAAAALYRDDAGLALTLLERGRGLLFAQALQLRTPLDDLRQVAPDLADRYQQLSHHMESPEEPPRPIEYTDTLRARSRTRAVALTEEIARRGQLNRDLDQILSAIRKIPGFESFLLPPTAQESINVAGAGPVAVVNVSRHRSDALIVAHGAIRVVPLPMATPEAVSAQVMKFIRAVDPPGYADDTSRTERTLLEVLGWLWDAIGEPVTDAVLSDGHPAADGGPPRLWWVPTGLLSLLPLHAAGSVPDRVISSYLPTLRAHGRPRGDDIHEATDRTLVVTMPSTPGAENLPGAEVEGEAVSALNPNASRLTGADATRNRVLPELARHANFHFAGHALGNLATPSASALLLHDQPVTVRDISLLRLTGANLAYLSACETAMSGMSAIDEVISIASGCMLAGYRQVVATLWPVPDGVAVRVATMVWRAFAKDGGTEQAATVLHQATCERRRISPDKPSLWAAYVHVGL